jgi:hypothetical protein
MCLLVRPSTYKEQKNLTDTKYGKGAGESNPLRNLHDPSKLNNNGKRG